MGDCEQGSCKPDKSCCASGSCGSKNGCSTGCEMSDKLLHLANEAWNELLKERMKELYAKQFGEHIDKTAAVAVEGCATYWKHKIDGKVKCNEFKQKVKEVFTS